MVNHPRVWIETDEDGDWLIELQRRRKKENGTPTDADLVAEQKPDQPTRITFKARLRRRPA